jgi:hypothetical protein
MLAPFTPCDKMPLVAFGDAKFATTMRGKRAGVSGVLFRKLKEMERCGMVRVVRVDEYRSSKVCSKCGGDMDQVIGANGDSLHAVLKCKSCCTVWNRDVNASRNLHHIALYMAANGNQRPTEFSRLPPPQSIDTSVSLMSG